MHKTVSDVYPMKTSMLTDRPLANSFYDESPRTLSPSPSLKLNVTGCLLSLQFRCRHSCCASLSLVLKQARLIAIHGLLQKDVSRILGLLFWWQTLLQARIADAGHCAIVEMPFPPLYIWTRVHRMFFVDDDDSSSSQPS